MSKQLILIDDRAEQAAQIRGFLTTWGTNYEVIANEHLLSPSEDSDAGREAFCHDILEFVRSNLTERTEAVLLDVLFKQGKDNEKESPIGYRLGKLIRLHFPRVPIILFTVLSHSEDVLDATYSFNFDGYIAKTDFMTWRRAERFQAALYKARQKRDEVLEECQLLRQREIETSAEVVPRKDPVIMHVSDIHYGIALGESDRRRQFGGTLEPLLRDVSENFEKDGIPVPNILVVSGDITSKGSITGYPLAHDFVVSLAKSLGSGLDREQIILAPGNHDVSRALSRFGCGLDPYDESITDVGEPNDYYRYRFAPFKMFFDGFYLGRRLYSIEDNRMFSIHDLREAFGLVIVGFNSCEVLDHSANGRDRGYISFDTIEEVKRQLDELGLAEGDALKVAVWHHPLLVENPGDPSYHRDLLKRLSMHGFRISLHGHIHRPFSDSRPGEFASEGIHQFGAGTIGANAEERPKEWPMHYEVLAFDLTSRNCTVHSRQRVGNEWLQFASFDRKSTYQFSF
jgi:3',5'-cyclic AMP phosphodiesterase CpdA